MIKAQNCLEVKSDSSEYKQVTYSNVSVAISAAVTAYGRIHMCKIKKKNFRIRR